MTKDVILKVQGLHAAEGDPDDIIEVISPGEYYFRNGKHYFLYDEVMEGGAGVTKNIIKVQKDYMELTKKGAVNVHMVFERGRQNITYYYTPYGSLQIGIDTWVVILREETDKIVVDVIYALDMNSELVGCCRICITAVPREGGEFTLQS